MKDYYKILGLKKTASEEEIRGKWVELMRKLHPDKRIQGSVEDGRVKEINEAYQVLKHSSTRVEYDLNRNYNRRKRSTNAKRISISVAIFVILVFAGSFIVRNRQVNNQRVLLTSIQKVASTHQHINASTHPRIYTSTPPRIAAPNVPNELNETNEPNIPNDLNVPNVAYIAASSPSSVDASTPSRIAAPNVPNELNETNAPNVPNIVPRIYDSPPPRIDSSTHVRDNSIIAKGVLNVPNVPNDPNGPNVPDVTLIATEQEVKQFFANYTERYIRKELEGFLSLFSLRAVQNHQDGLEGIRKLYADFFNQSKEIRYYLEDTGIEFYQNGLEIKARYEVVQTLKRGGEEKTWRGHIRWTLIKEQGVLKILALDY